MQVQPIHKNMIELKEGAQTKLVTMRVNQQLLAIPVEYVRDVLKGGRIAHVPLAPPEISGLMNLRGRVVTVVDMRRRLKLAPLDENANPMFIVVEYEGEYYSLHVDSVGDVLTIATAAIEKPPSNLSADWREIATGVHRLTNELLVIVDVDTLFSWQTK